jgi:hypothetical protein
MFGEGKVCQKTKRANKNGYLQSVRNFVQGKPENGVLLPRVSLCIPKQTRQMNNGSINGRGYYCPRSPAIMRLIDKWESPMIGKINADEAKKIVSDAIKRGAAIPAKKPCAKPRILRKCKNCQKMFEAFGTIEFCSGSCASVKQWNERKDRGLETHCVECGIQFKRVRAEKTCSPECSRARQRKNDKLKRQKIK